MKITPENIKWFKRRDGLEFYPVAWSEIGLIYQWYDEEEGCVRTADAGRNGKVMDKHKARGNLLPIFEPGEKIRVWSDIDSPDKADIRTLFDILPDGRLLCDGGYRARLAMSESAWQEKYGKPEPEFPEGWPVRVPYIPHICDGYGSLEANWSLEKYSGQPRAVCAIEWQNEHAPLQMDEAVKVWADPDGPVSAMPRHYADKGQCWINGNTSHSGATSREWNNIMRASDWKELYG